MAQAEQKHQQPLTKRRKFFILVIVMQTLQEVVNFQNRGICDIAEMNRLKNAWNGKSMQIDGAREGMSLAESSPRRSVQKVHPGADSAKLTA